MNKKTNVTFKVRPDHANSIDIASWDMESREKGSVVWDTTLNKNVFWNGLEWLPISLSSEENITLSHFSYNPESDKLEADKSIETSTFLGWQDFADSNTSEANPIVQSIVNGGEVQLTNNNNDTLTDGTTSVNSETTVVGLNDLWSTTSNTFVFGGTGIEKNDLLSFRIHLKISANIISQDFSLRFDFYDQINGLGTKQFSLTQQASIETLGAGVFRERILTIDAFVGDSILNGSAKLFLVGTKSFEVEVVGWNIRIFKIAR